MGRACRGNINPSCPATRLHKLLRFVHLKHRNAAIPRSGLLLPFLTIRHTRPYSTAMRADRARISCFPCRLSKRRCDKTLPSCKLCDKKDVDCKYPQRRGETYNASTDSGEARDTALDSSKSPDGSLIPSPNSEQLLATDPLVATTSAILFIAPQVFQDAQLEIPRADLAVPAQVTAQLGSDSQMREVVGDFFKCFHHWMPIICKKRFYSALLNPLFPRRCELSLLVLCMKLYCTAPPEDSPDARTPLYRLAKGFYLELETAGIMSIHLLQAAVLIACYEIAQAVYPAGYLTVGACARYGVALGIDKLMTDLNDSKGQSRPWIEVEEMRRVWWAVLMLDRQVCPRLELVIEC